MNIIHIKEQNSLETSEKKSPFEFKPSFSSYTVKNETVHENIFFILPLFLHFSHLVEALIRTLLPEFWWEFCNSI